MSLNNVRCTSVRLKAAQVRLNPASASATTCSCWISTTLVTDCATTLLADRAIPFPAPRAAGAVLHCYSVCAAHSCCLSLASLHTHCAAHWSCWGAHMFVKCYFARSMCYSATVNQYCCTNYRLSEHQLLDRPLAEYAFTMVAGIKLQGSELTYHFLTGEQC